MCTRCCGDCEYWRIRWLKEVVPGVNSTRRSSETLLCTCNTHTWAASSATRVARKHPFPVAISRPRQGAILGGKRQGAIWETNSRWAFWAAVNLNFMSERLHVRVSLFSRNEDGRPFAGDRRKHVFRNGVAPDSPRGVVCEAERIKGD